MKRSTKSKPKRIEIKKMKLYEGERRLFIILLDLINFEFGVKNGLEYLEFHSGKYKIFHIGLTNSIDAVEILEDFTISESDIKKAQ